MTLENKIINLKQSAILDHEIIVKLSNFEDFYKTFGRFEHFFISKSFLEKILYLKNQVIENPNSFILNSSTLRFVLETLIHSKLFLMEEKYIYTFFYSIYSEQIKKCENFISRLEYEIQLIDKYKIEEENTKPDKTNLSNNSEEDIQKYFNKIKKIEREIDARAEKELTIFWGDFKNMGYFLQKSLMEEQLLQKYESQLQHLKHLKNKKQEELFKKENLKVLFNFTNEDDVFNKLKETRRTWKAKAEVTSLEKEYELVYEITSASLHSTSYSIITNSETNEQEQIFALELICKYSKEITENLLQFLEFDRYSKIEVVNI